MSINVNNYVSAVNAYLHSSGGAKKTVPSVREGNFDKAEFSAAAREASSGAGGTSFADALKAAAARDAAASASPERISELKNAVASGNYFVPSSDIARSVLGE